MKIVTDLLEGKCDVKEFMCTYMNDDKLYDYVQNLIPKNAIPDPSNEYWSKCIMRSGLECYNFDVRQMLYAHCGYGEQEENQREIFNTIRALYLWVYPKQKCTNIYDDRINFYLDLEQNCFGGPEVAPLIKTVSREYFGVRPKSTRKNIAKAKILEIFHVEGKIRPRWIQGPQWPMGQYSPMRFISQE